MRLTGFAFTHPDGPARWGYLPLDDLAVVLGPNDAGKSRVVRWLASWLEHTPPQADEAGSTSGVFFAELDQTERDAVLVAAAASRQTADEPLLDDDPPVLRGNSAPL